MSHPYVNFDVVLAHYIERRLFQNQWRWLLAIPLLNRCLSLEW